MFFKSFFIHKYKNRLYKYHFNIVLAPSEPWPLKRYFKLSTKGWVPSKWTRLSIDWTQYDNKIHEPTTYCLKLKKFFLLLFWENSAKSNPILFLLVLLLCPKIVVIIVIHLQLLACLVLNIFPVSNKTIMLLLLHEIFC